MIGSGIIGSRHIMEKIKILRIVSRLNIGGPAIHTILLSSELNEKGYETILVKGQESPHEGDMLSLAQEKGVEPYVIPEMGRELKSFDDITALFKIYRLIANERPSIVHTHTAKAGTLGRLAVSIYRAILYAKYIIIRLFFQRTDSVRLQVIAVHTFHGHVLKGYFGRLKTLLFVLIERLMAYKTDKIITLSDKLKSELVQMKIAPQQKIEVIPLGLELKRFVHSSAAKGSLKRSLGIPEDFLVVGIVGRLVPIKGHRIFLDAVRIIIDERNREESNQAVKFLIVGDGELHAELKNYAEKLGIQEHIIFTGFRLDMPDIYADTDIVVLSSFNEGTPVSLIEAMASGVPVVATRVGGVPDLVHDRATGLLVRPGDAEALANAIIELLKDSELRKSLGKSAINSAYPKYDISKLVESLDNLYSALLKK